MGEALKLIDFAIWYLMGFCLLSHLPRHTRVYIVYWKGRKGLQIQISPLSGCRLCTMCDVRVTTILLWCRQHCPLIGQHAPYPDWQDQGRDSEGLALNHFQVFGNPSLGQSRQTKQQSIAKFLEKHNEFSTILFTKLCLMSVQGCCKLLRHTDAPHWVTCSTVCSNMNR